MYIGQGDDVVMATGPLENIGLFFKLFLALRMEMLKSKAVLVDCYLRKTAL